MYPNLEYASQALFTGLSKHFVFLSRFHHT